MRAETTRSNRRDLSAAHESDSRAVDSGATSGGARGRRSQAPQTSDRAAPPSSRATLLLGEEETGPTVQQLAVGFERQNR